MNSELKMCTFLSNLLLMAQRDVADCRPSFDSSLSRRLEAVICSKRLRKPIKDSHQYIQVNRKSETKWYYV